MAKPGANPCRGIRPSTAILVAGLALWPRLQAFGQSPTPASSPTPRSIALRADNDAFDFWEPAWDRPDEDYTSGVRLVFNNAWKPWWSSRLWTRVPRCGPASTTCVAASAWVGQDIYAAERDTNERQKTAGARPNAGWLFYGEEVRRLAARRADLVDVTVGVTGRASLAEYTQRFAHAIDPTLNAPIDWGHQLGFEPGIVVAYEHDELLPVISVGAAAMQLIPSAQATTGNVLTQATAKIETHVGFNLRNPWLPSTASGAPEVAVSASIAGNAVARNLFLDARAPGGGASVGHEPFYAERALGVSLTFGELTAGYRAVFDGRTYAVGRPHAWSSITAGWAFDP